MSFRPVSLLKRVAPRAVLGMAALGALWLASVPSAFAAGAGAVTFTQTFHNATQVIDPGPPEFGANPCTGAPGTITLTYNGVFHVTYLTSGQGAGTSWATGTQTGSFNFVPSDSSLPTYTGHFTTWFGDENNLQNGVEHSTFTVHGTGSDGSTLIFHDTSHMSVSASGITLSFDKPMCG